MPPQRSSNVVTIDREVIHIQQEDDVVRAGLINDSVDDADDVVHLACLPAVRREAVHGGSELLYTTYVAAPPEPDTPRLL